MIVGYHHHVPSVFSDEGHVYVPGHFGMFTDELARQAGTVVYYTYETKPTGIESHRLSDAVRCVNLGPRPPAPVALLFPKRVLRRVDLVRDAVDVLLVRGPGPLLPSLLAAAGDVPAAAFLVGDYQSWGRNTGIPRWRNALIRLYRNIYRRRQTRAVRDALVLTQNPWLLEHGTGSPFAHARIVFTSSITGQMIQTIDEQRARAVLDGQRSSRRLLYTGRIEEEKGVLLIVRALAMLRARGLAVELELVGWASPRDPTPRRVVELATDLGVKEHLAMPGFAGRPDTLVDRYLQADVFVFASPTEWGSSHTISEAMVSGTPVVTSAFEGIRGELRDGEHAVVVAPGSAAALADGIELVLRDDALRSRLIANGRRWAEGRTNERSATLALSYLAEWRDQRRINDGP